MSAEEGGFRANTEKKTEADNALWSICSCGQVSSEDASEHVTGQCWTAVQSEERQIEQEGRRDEKRRKEEGRIDGMTRRLEFEEERSNQCEVAKRPERVESGGKKN